MATFVGEWETKRHRSNDPGNPELITMTIRDDSSPGSLDGIYDRIGADARMIGAFDATGLFWTATFDGTGSTGESGQVLFVLTPDGNTMYGGWTSNQNNAPMHSWYGTRANSKSATKRE